MKLFGTTALIAVLSVGLFGASGAMAGGMTSVRAGTDVVAPQITRELGTRTGKQVSEAASQAVRESQSR